MIVAVHHRHHRQFGEAKRGRQGLHPVLTVDQLEGRVDPIGRIEVGGVNRFGIARLTSDLIFRDGFERASGEGWPGN